MLKMKGIVLLIVEAEYWVSGGWLYYSLQEKHTCSYKERNMLLWETNKAFLWVRKDFYEELLLELRSEEWSCYIGRENRVSVAAVKRESLSPRWTLQVFVA